MILVREIVEEPKKLSVYLSSYQKEEIFLLKHCISGRSWDPFKRCWKVPYTKETLKRIRELFPKKCRICFTVKEDIPKFYEGPFYPNKKRSVPKPKIERVIPKYSKALDALEQDLILRRYSPATIKSYKAHLRDLLFFYNDRNPSTLNMNDIKKFLLYKIERKSMAERTQNQAINAIKYYYENVLGYDRMFIDLKRPKIPKNKPGYLSQGEVSRLLNATSNLKHKAILMTIYAAGLRISEVINLHVSDIRSDENHILIRNSKGKKDRTTLLSPSLLKTLRNYFKVYQPKYHLFEGQIGGAYSARSIQSIMSIAVKKSNVRHATPHTLRHSFATHLVQNGTDITHVKELLGHGSIKTTEIYLHLTQKDLRKIESPLDKLNI